METIKKLSYFILFIIFSVSVFGLTPQGNSNFRSYYNISNVLQMSSDSYCLGGLCITNWTGVTSICGSNEVLNGDSNCVSLTTLGNNTWNKTLADTLYYPLSGNPDSFLTSESDSIAIGLMEGNDSVWSSTYNDSYLTSESDSLAISLMNGNDTIWSSTYNSSYLTAETDSIAISIITGNASAWLSTYNSSYLTIETDPLWSGNQSLIAFLNNDVVFYDVLPNTTLTYDLGSPTQRWNNTYTGYLSGDDAQFSGDVEILGDLNVTDFHVKNIWVINMIATGNLTGDYIIGNGSYLTDVNYTETDAIAISLITGNASAWLSTYNDSYLTSESDSLAISLMEGNASAWLSTYNNSYLTSESDSLAISLMEGNDSVWSSTYNSSYLTSESDPYYYSNPLSYYNTSTLPTVSGNTSWNETLADTLYYPLSGNPDSFLTEESDTLAIGLMEGNDSVWSSTYNESYLTAETDSIAIGLMEGNASAWLSTYNDSYLTAETDSIAIGLMEGNDSVWSSTYNDSYLTSETDSIAIGLMEGNASAWLSTYNDSYLTAETDSIAIGLMEGNASAWLSTYNDSYLTAETDSIAIGLMEGNDSVWSSTYNDSYLTAETDSIAIGLMEGNDSVWSSTYNDSYLTSESDTLAISLMNGNDSAWSSTYNSTYDLWSYNQTEQSNSYTDDVVSGINNLSLSDIETNLGNWSGDKSDYYTSTQINDLNGTYGASELGGYNADEFLVTTEEGNLNVNSSDFWDGLDTEADLTPSSFLTAGDYISYTADTLNVDNQGILDASTINASQVANFDIACPTGYFAQVINMSNESVTCVIESTGFTTDQNAELNTTGSPTFVNVTAAVLYNNLFILNETANMCIVSNGTNIIISNNYTGIDCSG